MSPALASWFFTTKPPGKPLKTPSCPPRSWPRDAPEQFSPAVRRPLWDCFLPGDPAGGQGRVTNTILPGGISGLLAGGSYVPRTVGSPRDPHDGYTWPTLQRRTKRAWSLLKAMSVLFTPLSTAVRMPSDRETAWSHCSREAGRKPTRVLQEPGRPPGRQHGPANWEITPSASGAAETASLGPGGAPGAGRSWPPMGRPCCTPR